MLALPARPWLLCWLGAGLLAAGVGTAFSGGYASSPTSVGTITDAGALLANAGTTPVDHYAQAVTAQNALAITWPGLWGRVAQRTSLFQVSLRAADVGTGGTFYVELGLRNTQFNHPYDGARVRIDQYPGACDSAARQEADSFTSQVLSATSTDAKVVFPGLTLPAGPNPQATWCFEVARTGVAPDYLAQDTNGTFLRRASTTDTPDPLDFFALVNRSS